VSKRYFLKQDEFGFRFRDAHEMEWMPLAMIEDALNGHADMGEIDCSSCIHEMIADHDGSTSCALGHASHTACNSWMSCDYIVNKCPICEHFFYSSSFDKMRCEVGYALFKSECEKFKEVDYDIQKNR
jgi:hypothetical protein